MADPKQTPDVLPMPATGQGSLDYWRNQVTAAQQMIFETANARGWDQNVMAYLGKGLSQMPIKDTVVVNKEQSRVEMKKSLLFFQTPDVAATASEQAFEQAAPLVAAVLTQELERINMLATVDEALMDVLCPSGIGCTVIGYEAFVDPQNPEQMMPSMLNPTLPQMGPDGQPVLKPNIVRERYFWERFSPKRLLYPVTFTGSDFDKASWLGFTFDLDKVVGQRLFDLTDEEMRDASAPPDPERTLIQSDVGRGLRLERDNKITFTQIWYRASDCDPTVGDPEIIRQLIYMDGKDAPLVHRDSPYQEIQHGQRINGMKGFPLHPLTLRYVSDQAIPPSDCSVTREAVRELSIGRTQMIQQRDRALPMLLGDSTRLGDATAKIARGEIQEIVLVPGMDTASPPLVPVNRGTWPRENFAFNDIISRDIDEAWSLGANQAGVDNPTRRTATEISVMQSGTETRMDKERAKVLRWYARGCEKFLSLLQMFQDEQKWARIVGPQGLPILQAWDKFAIAGDFAVTLAPDSSQRIDAAADKKRIIDLFQLFGNDPLTNQVELRKAVWRKVGFDPEKLVKIPEPKPPDQPQISVSIKGDDLNPMLPQYPNVATLLSVQGIQMAAPTGMPPTPPGQAPNPGAPPPVSAIGKRTDEAQASGMLPGAGMAPSVPQ